MKIYARQHLPNFLLEYSLNIRFQFFQVIVGLDHLKEKKANEDNLRHR